MQADFLDAHERHWEDAERLFRVQRWANADHLYGMAAECGLKRLLVAFGMPYDQNNVPQDPKDRVHANGIWDRYQSYVNGRPASTAYAIDSTNPFADWEAAQRYAHQAGFDQLRSQKHQSGAQQVRALVQNAKRDGLLQ